ncbi:hypothetical protein ACS3UN_09995 [Oscillospiraceae bacterium LTW-04]|nr:hypothetical protein RBH76_11745 [Oscillospiraceae bacterium MB24-C1]
MSDELYKQQFAEWLNEQKIRVREFERTIETLRALIASTEKQLTFHLQGANAAIKEYNAWAKENLQEQVPALVVDE